MKNIYTIGYESATLADFIATLKDAGIEIVLDIRALPLSRRAGFSKTPLSNALRDAGIDYLHLRALGTPKAGRDAAKSGDLKTLRSVYMRHLKGPEAQAELAKATEIAKNRRACLLCVEKHHTACHRSLVAPLIAQKNNQTIENLAVREGASLQSSLNLRD